MSETYSIGETVDAAILSRRSVRQFLPDPISLDMVMEILDLAARSPSGHNTQAWNVHVLTGGTLHSLSTRILQEFVRPDVLSRLKPEFDSYPSEWVSPYIDRRRKVGKDMYTLLGVARGDKEGMQEQLVRNYTFFDAPVGLIFTLQRIMIPGSVMDLGMFLQSIMLAARARGIDTCTQAAFAPFHRLIADELTIPVDQVVICGMSMGRADSAAVVNRVVTHREPATSFTRIHS